MIKLRQQMKVPRMARKPPGRRNIYKYVANISKISISQDNPISKWWSMSVTPPVRRLKQEDSEFKVSLAYLLRLKGEQQS